MGQNINRNCYANTFAVHKNKHLHSHSNAYTHTQHHADVFQPAIVNLCAHITRNEDAIKHANAHDNMDVHCNSNYCNANLY